MIGLSRPLVAIAMLSVISTSLGSETPDKKVLEEIASYRQWTHATLQPVPVDFSSLVGG